MIVVMFSKSQALETSQRLLPGGATDHAVRGALFDSHLGGSSGSAPVGFCGDVESDGDGWMEVFFRKIWWGDLRGAKIYIKIP